MPACVIVPTILFDDVNKATAASLIVPFSVNLIFLLISFIHSKVTNPSALDNQVALDLDGPSFFSWKTYLFLFPARSSFIELLICLILTPGYTALMTFIIHKHTL